MELRIGWRDAQGHLSYFSKDGRAKINKSPIGPVHEVEYLEKGGNKNQDVFMITTKQRTKITFNVDNLNPTIWKICTWTNKWLELKTAGQEMQLARMLSALCQSKTFEYNLNTDDFENDVTNCTKDMEEDFDSFLSAAKKDVMDVDSLSEAIEKCVGMKKRKLTDDTSSKKRLTKEELLKMRQLEEIKTKDGLEAETVRNTEARLEISLDKLKLSPHLQKDCPVRGIRVEKLAREMKKIFDPSQLIFTVFPTSQQFSPNSTNEDVTYWVIAGQHRFAALLLLDKEGCLTHLPTLQDRKVLCVVINSSSTTLQSYVAKRNGLIQADCQEHSTHQLIFTLAGLRERMTEETASETIRRMSSLLKVSGDEISYLRRISQWSNESLTDLTTIIRAFINFQTLDVQEQKRLSSVVRKGLPLPIKRTLLKNISRLKSEQITNLKNSVLSNRISLAAGVAMCVKEQEREKTLNLVSQIMEESEEIVMRDYGDHFNNDVLDSFSKAVYGKNEQGILKSNTMGRNLVKYCMEITKGNDTTEPQVMVWSVEDYKLVLDSNVNVLVAICDWNEEFCGRLSDILNIIKPGNSDGILLICNKIEGIEEAKKVLTERGRIEIKNVYFERENSIKEGSFMNNLYYGILSGEIYFESINILNVTVKAALKSIVEKMSPKNCRIVALYSSKSVPVCIVHNEETEHIDYLVSESNKKILDTELKNQNLDLNGKSDVAEESGFGESILDLSVISGIGYTVDDEELNEDYASVEDSDEIIEPTLQIKPVTLRNKFED